MPKRREDMTPEDLAAARVRPMPMRGLTDEELGALAELGRHLRLFREPLAGTLNGLAERAEREIADREVARELRRDLDDNDNTR